jgi:hypothetical protein
MLMSGMAMAAAAAAFMPLEPTLENRPSYPHKAKRRRYRKPADRSKKQCLLKGIRP